MYGKDIVGKGYMKSSPRIRKYKMVMGIKLERCSVNAHLLREKKCVSLIALDSVEIGRL